MKESAAGRRLAHRDNRTVTAYLALGSNLGGDLGRPVNQLVRARSSIGAIPFVTQIAASALYQSPAWGSDEPQPDYVNAVVAIQTTLSAHDLWQAVSRIEQAQGRIRGIRNAARTLDIDVLMYGDAVIETPELVIPHPRMHERAFVLLPLLDIAPGILIPGRGVALECVQGLGATHVERLRDNQSWI